MQDIGHRDCIGLSGDCSLNHVCDCPHTTTGNDWNRHRLAHLTYQVDVVPLSGSFAIYRCDQYLSGPEFDSAFDPLYYIHPSPLTTIVGICLPSAMPLRLGFYGQHHGLRAEHSGNLADKLWSGNGRCVDGAFVGTGAQYVPDIVDAADPTPNRDWDEHFV